MAPKTDLNLSPEENCPRFSFCDINRCPLQEDYNKLQNYPTDPAMISKKKCVAKNIRKRIAKAFGLKSMGLTGRELSAKKKWDALPESVKQERITKLKTFSPILKSSKEEVKISPNKVKQISKPGANPNKTALRVQSIDISGDLCGSGVVMGGLVSESEGGRK